MASPAQTAIDRSRAWLRSRYLRSRWLRIARKIPTYLKYQPPSDPYYLRVPGPHTEAYSDAKPFKLLRVSPDEIQYCSNRPYVRWRNVGKVKGGDWDERTVPFEETPFYDGIDASFFRSLESHFHDGRDWEDTPFIQQVAERVQAGATPWECASVDDIRRRCRKMDRLYADIATNGYKPQHELLDRERDRAAAADRRRLFRFVKRHTILGRDEIAVDIGRDGSFLFYDSKNRLAIAKLLALDAIPVRVVVRHTEWQAARDRIREGREPSRALAEHPDMDALVSQHERRSTQEQH